MNKPKMIFKNKQSFIPKIIFTFFLLIFFLFSANPVNAQGNSKAGQWVEAGGKMILSGNHSFTTSWASNPSSRQDNNKWWQGRFWDPSDNRQYIPWKDAVKNSVAPVKGQITVMGPGNIGLFQRIKGATIHMYDSETKAEFIPWKNTIDWDNGGTVQDFYINGEQIAANTVITLDITAVMSMFNNQSATGELSFIAPQKIEYEIWFFPREGGKVISKTDYNKNNNAGGSGGGLGGGGGGGGLPSPSGKTVGEITSGKVFDETTNKWLNPGDNVRTEHILTTKGSGNATITVSAFGKNTVVTLDNDTKIRIFDKKPNKKKASGFFLFAGRLWSLFRPHKMKNGFVVETFNSVAAVEGTEFETTYNPETGKTNVSVFEGTVRFECKMGTAPPVYLKAGMSANMDKNCNITSDNSTINNANTGSNSGGNQINPIADSHVYAYSYSNWNKANWGKYEILGAGWNPTGGEKRAYLKFDISGIDKSTFEKASLKLFHYHTAGGNSAELGVYTVRDPWNEGNGNYNPANVAAPGEICWINQPQSDQYPVAYFNPGTQTNNFVEVDITTLVKAWLEGMPNYGLAIKVGESYLNGPTSVYGFYSREHENIDKRPSLIINGATNGTTNTTSEGKLDLPNVAGEWEMTCIGDIIYKFKLTLVQYENVFYGDMVRTNGNERLAKIEGQILPNNRIKFTRSIGNWKQYYTGEINQKSGSCATSFEGMFGFKDQLNHEWYAKAINTAKTVNSNVPKIDGEWELTVPGNDLYIFDLKITQSGNTFEGSMVCTNRSNPNTIIKGHINPDGSIEFLRSTGNWKQYYTGEINQKSGSRATSFEGMFGFKDQLNNEWYAKAKNGASSPS